MKKSYVVLDFTRFPVPDKVAKGRDVISLMTGNPNFTTPDVPLAELKSLTDDLETRYNAAQHGYKEETALLREVEEAWNYQMRLEARYVERISGLNEAVILSAGFNVSKEPAPVQKSELSAENGELPGSVFLRRQAIIGAKAYMWQYCANIISPTEEGWTNAGVTSKASVLLENLEPVTRHWFRVATVTPEGTSAYNDPIMHVVV